MTVTAPDTALFHTVDAAPDPRAFVGFLDRQAVAFRQQRTNRIDALGLQAGDSVLDAGCGPAIDTFELEARVGPTGRVHGIDLSSTMITEARERAAVLGSAAAFDVADVRALPFDDGTFDVACTSLLLLHVADAATAVRELARVVRPGGRLACSEPDHQMAILAGSDPEAAERLIRNALGQTKNPRIGRELLALFVDAGLVNVKVDLVPVPMTNWDRFRAAFEPRLRDASVEARAVLDDLEVRAATGRFFGCSMMMTATGTKPQQSGHRR